MSELRIGVIGGSGLGAALASKTQGQRHEIETPFGRPSDAIVETRIGEATALFLSRHGPGHLLNPSQVPYRANIFALKQLGCTHIIASGAVGSLREELRPRDLVIPDQTIDKTSKRANTFYENAAVHVELAEPFCPVLRRVLLEAAAQLDPPLAVHDGGCYVCMEGPAFSTRAESLMHRLWGGDLIGMTAMPEARLAREAEISYATVALVTDYDCWRQKPAMPDAASQEKADPFVLLKEIIANLDAATENAIRLIQHAIAQLPARAEELLAAPAQQALKLAIWSDKSCIHRAEIERLRPLWARYFD